MTPSFMRIGVDFDNTVVCYDDVFYQAAVEKGWLPAGDHVLAKGAVRDALRAQGMEEEWIHLQGYVYGTGMHLARPYPGVKDFFRAVCAAGIEAVIISHRTKTPFRGPQTDLHAAAQAWLHREGFFETAETGLSEQHVFFELTKEQKLARIAAMQPRYFIDDLIEFLSEPSWPADINRVLFDPAGHHSGMGSFPRMATWREISATILSGCNREPPSELKGLPALLGAIDAGPASKVVRLDGGTNNAVYRVDTPDGTFCCKVYGPDPGERDRFACETTFVKFAWTHDIRVIPELLSADAASRSALFRFVAGAKVSESEIDEGLVDHALAFCRALDASRNDPAASLLPNASDCCFSLNEHLQSVALRLARLGDLEHRGARTLIEGVRKNIFPQLDRRLREFAARSGEAMDRLLTPGERNISASDFGFHNALVDEARRVTFLDFEYAGWDDPAKMIADFFAQADRPVPLNFLDRFLTEFTSGRPDAAAIAARCRAILPLHRIKWALILLNGFLPQRPGPIAPSEAELARRLDRAESIIARIEPWFVANSAL